jgi:pyruvate carboxylase
MTAMSQAIELPVKLKLSTQAGQQLAQRAARSGRDVADYASDLIEQAVAKPTLDEVLAPFRQQVADSGISDEQMDEFFEELRNEAWIQQTTS